MKIVERYPKAYSILSGRGFGILFLPARALFSCCYAIWRSLSDRATAVCRGRRRPKKSGEGAKIISVGNIEVGGSGKTPCVIALAAAVAERGGSAAVVTRGYKSVAARYGPFVVAEGRPPTHAGVRAYTMEESYVEAHFGTGGLPGAADRARLIGDEVMLYRNRNIPVVIDPRRERGINAARKLFAPTHILLDDAYQQRAVGKDLDILLLDASNPLGGGALLPLGPLREPPSAIRRADAVVFTRSKTDTVPREVESLVEGRFVRFARHRPTDLVTREGTAIPLSFLDGKSVCCFSGIARPHSFEELLQSLGARVDVSFRYIDHHVYTRGDIDAMTAAGGESGFFITTEKDLAKAAHLFPAAAEVSALRIAMDIDGIGDLLDMVDR